jgi:hypothetical protein
MLVKEAEMLYKHAIGQTFESSPASLSDFIIRERLIGGAAELKRFLDQPSSIEDDLNQQLTALNDAN